MPDFQSLLPTPEGFGIATDLYELTMAAGYFENAKTERATFELYVRRFPKDRSYLVCAGLEQACHYLVGPSPVNGIWLGAAEDVIIRQRGVEFVDGSAPGFAAIVGAAPDSKTAVEIARASAAVSVTPQGMSSVT